MSETTGALLDRAFRTMLREELKPIETRLDGVETRLDGVERGLADLKESLVGLIDERFPPIDQKPREGGPSSATPVAAAYQSPQMGSQRSR